MAPDEAVGYLNCLQNSKVGTPDTVGLVEVRAAGCGAVAVAGNEGPLYTAGTIHEYVDFVVTRTGLAADTGLVSRSTARSVQGPLASFHSNVLLPLQLVLDLCIAVPAVSAR